MQCARRDHGVKCGKVRLGWEVVANIERNCTPRSTSVLAWRRGFQEYLQRPEVNEKNRSLDHFRHCTPLQPLPDYPYVY